jgi:hypothetical protein
VETGVKRTIARWLRWLAERIDPPMRYADYVPLTTDADWSPVGNVGNVPDSTAMNERVYPDRTETGGVVLRCAECNWEMKLDEGASLSTAASRAEEHEEDHEFGKIGPPG